MRLNQFVSLVGIDVRRFTSFPRNARSNFNARHGKNQNLLTSIPTRFTKDRPQFVVVDVTRLCLFGACARQVRISSRRFLRRIEITETIESTNNEMKGSV